MKYLIILVLFLSSYSYSEKSSDIESLFIGKYKYEYDLGVNGIALGYTAYLKDYTLQGVAVVDANGKVMSVAFSGSWKIENKHLLTEVKESSNPGVIPVDSKLKMEIIKIDETGYFYKMSNGEIYKEQKITKINHIKYTK